MLSLVITLFSIASEPSELAMASWLNSTVCFCTALNLEINRGRQERRGICKQWCELMNENQHRMYDVLYDVLHLLTVAPDFNQKPLKKLNVGYDRIVLAA